MGIKTNEKTRSAPESYHSVGSPITIIVLKRLPCLVPEAVDLRFVAPRVLQLSLIGDLLRR